MANPPILHATFTDSERPGAAERAGGALRQWRAMATERFSAIERGGEGDKDMRSAIPAAAKLSVALISALVFAYVAGMIFTN